MSAKIRAKSVIKIHTGKSHLDVEIPKGSDHTHLLREGVNMAHFNIGASGTLRLVYDMLEIEGMPMRKVAPEMYEILEEWLDSGYMKRGDVEKLLAKARGEL